MTDFIDTSIFQGILEFSTPEGILQAHHEGNNIYHVYTVASGNSYSMNMQIKINGNIKEPRDKMIAIYRAYIKAEENR